MRPSLRLQGILALLVTAFSWGLNWPVLKLVLLEWPPLTFRVFTGAGGVALLICVALLRGERLWPPQGQWLRLVVSAVLNISSWMGLASLSLLWLDASEAAIIAYTMPVWAAMLAWPVLGERPTRLRVAGLVLGLSGMSVLMAGQLLGAPASVLVAKLPGVACILGTAVLFALGAVVTKRYPVAMPPVSNVAWQIAIGSVPLVGVAALFDSWDLHRVGVWGWAGVAYVSVIALCISYLAWFRALRLLPAGTATIGTLLVPVIGVTSSALVLGEPLGVRALTALGLTVAGVVLASRG